MNIEEARVHVMETIGASWQLGSVKVELVPGAAVGEPTRQRVTVTLDYHPGGRPDLSADGHHVWAIGPHLTFEGVGLTLDEALAVATGIGRAHDTVQRTGSDIAHAATEKVPA